jgi:DNA-directed RNA polymerase subunit L
MACSSLIEELEKLKDKFESDSVVINEPVSTTENEFEIILENIDHTIGKIIEYMMHEIYYNERELLTFCGFHKKHPHDNFSIIRIALNEPMEKAVIRDYFITCIEECKKIFLDFQNKF